MYFLPLDNQNLTTTLSSKPLAIQQKALALVFKASGHSAEGLSKAVSKRSHSSCFSSWLVHENLKSKDCSFQPIRKEAPSSSTSRPSQSALRSFLLALSNSDPQALTMRTPRSFNLTSLAILVQTSWSPGPFNVSIVKLSFTHLC